MDSNSNKGNQNNDNIISFVLRGEIPLRVFKFLASRSSYSYKIAEILSLNPNSVNKVLRQMKKKNIVKCLNPDSHRRKYYTLTEEALKFKDIIFTCIDPDSKDD